MKNFNNIYYIYSEQSQENQNTRKYRPTGEEKIMLKVLTGLATGTIIATVSLPATAELILSGRCHMGMCWDQKFLSKTLVEEGTDGSLYAIELAFRDWPMGSEPPATFDPPQIGYAYCSTSRPAFIFQPPSAEANDWFVNLLNPGGDWSGYNMGSYPVYWATCHNFVGPNFFSEEMTRRAESLGYSLDLPSNQIQLEDPLSFVK